MKTLIVYYSFTGNNDGLAHKLRERLDCDLVRIQPARKRTSVSILLDLIFRRVPKLQEYNIPFSDYSHLILIAPVWAGRIATPMQTFLNSERENILSYSFISFCGGVTGQKEKIGEYLESTLQRKPVAVEEIWANDLLPPQQKNKVKFTTPYRVKEDDWKVLNSRINAFAAAVTVTTSDKLHV